MRSVALRREADSRRSRIRRNLTVTPRRPNDMKPEQVEKLRQRLLELSSELQALEQASREDTAPVELDQARVGRLSRMDAMQAQEMAQETARRRQRQLVEIDGALRRIASGDFGYCFVCGEAIDVRRLEANPANTRCIGCAED
jgi:DnaK suppressor protein